MPYFKKYHRFLKPLDREAMLTLIDRSAEEILWRLNSRNNGLAGYLKLKSPAPGDIEAVVSLIAKACSARNSSSSIERLFRTIFWYRETFLQTVLSVIHHSLGKKFSIDLPHLVQNYILILRHILRKKIESFEVIQKIFHELQNYLNRMMASKMRGINEVLSEFRELEKDVDRQQEIYMMQLSIDQPPPENYRQLSVMPHSNDVINCPSPFLRPNIIDGPYSSANHYLDIQFRLMREDMLRSFRKSVAVFRNSLSSKQRELDEAYVYKNVRVHHPCQYTIQGVFYSISFKTQKVVNWKLTKAFIPGSLVCLTYDHFQTAAFAVVKERQPQSGSSRDCQLKVTLEHPEDQLPEQWDFVMIETTAYFEPYKHVLSAIQGFHESNLPFCDGLVYLDFEDCDADYLEKLPFCLHEQCPPDTSNPSDNADHSCKVFNVLDLDQWPTADELKLDEYQHKAFQTALSKNISLIQGPPGTGKTFLGVKIVKALLDNVSDGPIVICCYTNHALDQFLERILPYTNKIVRLGNQGKSEMLKSHVLSNLTSVVRQCRFQPDINFLRTDVTFEKTYQVVTSLVKDILELGSAPAADEDAMILNDLRRTCDEITNLQNLLTKAESKYFDDDILNAMVDSQYKEELSKGEGSNMNVLSRSIKGWLCLKNQKKTLYQYCNDIFAVPESDVPNIASKDEVAENKYQLWELPLQERFNLFKTWRNTCVNILKEKIADEIANYTKLLQKYNKPLDADIYAFIKNSRVVGMTTTGAAMYSQYMKAVKPHIILVEEAAEVLESHIIASLVPSIQHMILIGDHQQLRPLPADHDLAVNFNLNISLFERLFKNNAPSATLCSQHRMRPCIAELLVPDIYEALQSHESVQSFENIKGINGNMFFVQHSEMEDATSFGKSFSNEHEAQFMVGMCKYLVHQGYDQSQITVLTTYGGQQSQVLNCAKEALSDVKITTVDNYQGEENDIILISFVRSNPSGSIGFLKESNRVCVALSRARKALYCIGNFEQYARRSELWASILVKLKAGDAFGNDLPLQCQNHAVSITYVSNPNDFNKRISRGCDLACGYQLPCGHMCTSPCHLDDPSHLAFRCQEPCEKNVHVDGILKLCKKLCCEPCEIKKRRFVMLPCGHRVALLNAADTIDVLLSKYICSFRTSKRLPCGHLDSSVPCSVPSDEHQCNALVRVVLDCGHLKKVPCHQKLSPGKVVCQELQMFTAPCGHTVHVPCGISLDDDALLMNCPKSCDALLSCGHPCTGQCRWCFGTNIHAMCIEPCDKRLPCGHQCEGKCDAPCPPCKKACQMKCPHTNCVNPCERPCVKCTKCCSWRCDHIRCYADCWEECSGRPCNEPCSSELGCGHACIGFCGEPCPYLCRICQRDMLDCKNPAEDRFVLLENCDHIIEVNKLTQHIKSKGDLFEWPDCPVCSKIVTHSTRYYKELRAAKDVVIANANAEDKIPDLFYLLRTMFGCDYLISWRFQDVQRKIQTILEHEKPSAAALMVLENCLLFLQDLVRIDQKLSEVEDCFGIECMLDSLILWICNHLTVASYQQMSEVGMAVQVLKDKMKACFDK